MQELQKKIKKTIGITGGTKLAKVIEIRLETIGDKEWVKVIFDNGFYWIPKLEEIGEIANKIGICEDRKYSFPKHNVKGAEMVIEYLREAILIGFDKETLKTLNQKYEIPSREKVKCPSDSQ